MSTRGELEILIKAVNETSQPFSEAETSIKELAKAREYANKVVFEQQRAEQLLTQVFRYQHKDLYNTVEIMGRIGSIGTSLITIANARAISEMRVADATRDVTKAQDALKVALDLFGDDSIQYKAALEDLETAERNAERAAKDQESALLATGLQAVGTASQVGALALKLGEFTAIQQAGGILIPIAIVATAVHTLTDPKYNEEVAENEQKLIDQVLDFNDIIPDSIVTDDQGGVTMQSGNPEMTHRTESIDKLRMQYGDHYVEEMLKQNTVGGYTQSDIDLANRLREEAKAGGAGSIIIQNNEINIEEMKNDEDLASFQRRVAELMRQAAREGQ